VTDNERAFLSMVALGWFEVRPDGSIWRHFRWTQGGTPTLIRVEPRPAECSESDGYPTIMFQDGETRRKVFAHRVVWMITNQADIPRPMQVNHIDGNRKNRHPSNLEPVTPSENVKHGIRVLGRRPPRATEGQHNSQAKLTAKQVMEIRALWEARALSQPAMAERFGVKQSTISAIVLRKSWKHLG
jgi:hypothetical protein